MLNIRAWDSLKKEMIYFKDLSIFKFLEREDWDFFLASEDILKTKPCRDVINVYTKESTKGESKRFELMLWTDLEAFDTKTDENIEIFENDILEREGVYYTVQYSCGRFILKVHSELNPNYNYYREYLELTEDTAYESMIRGTIYESNNLFINHFN